MLLTESTDEPIFCWRYVFDFRRVEFNYRFRHILHLVDGGRNKRRAGCDNAADVRWYQMIAKTEQNPHVAEGERPAGLELAQFFPYRLSVLADLVSNAVSQVYADRFDLTRAEWRLLAALGVNRKMVAKDLGPYSALDKMQVSRAVQRLEDAGYIQRHEDTDDRRSKVLQLTAAGRALYQKIWPLVVAREEYILSALEPGERSVLARVMEKVQRRTAELIQRG